MKKFVLIFPLLCTAIWTQSCKENFPRHKKPPAINHSNPDNKPVITTCRKYSNDQFNLCKCFDKSGSEVMGENKPEVTLFCCQCPETFDEAYANFKDIDLGSAEKFNFSSALEIEIKRCPNITVSSLQKVTKIIVENSKEFKLQSGASLPKLEILNIVGQSKPVKYDEDIGTSVTMAEGVLSSGSSTTELSMKNTKITKFPRNLVLKTLDIDTSLFTDFQEKSFPDISSASIEKLKITNSEILSIFKLGLSSYQKPFTFSGNKIYSSCQTQQDKEKCFLTSKKDLTYTANKIRCLCSELDGADCTTESKEKAITKFECGDEILKNTDCSDLQGDDNSLQYLKKENVSDTCSGFERDLAVLDLNINPEEDPNIPHAKFPIWLPVVLGVISVGVVIAAVITIIHIKNKKKTRRKSLYKPVKEDFAPEGVLVEEED
eukprot:GFUD01009907.1.p1 GENE.GFUD01009907.1~~GFUD01009907.1.p1  ORF type:complete len:433 (+),score=112.76 GFUD01009907.1:63-1361(+)